MEIRGGLENILKLYDHLNYFDQYGGSVLLFILITIFLFIIMSYCFAKINSQPIVDDWVNQRCKLNIIPFAGFITHPDGITASEYTYQNFNYCAQTILSSITGMMVEPITFVIKMINDVLDAIKNAINEIRAMFDKIRVFFQTISEEIMGRVMNMMIPLQQMIISFRDLVSKMQGSMTTGLFTLLGGYYALQALMGAIAEFIIIILIALAAMIVILWIVPFTWGMAASMTAIFISIAIPMAIILTFMLDVLKAKPDLQIPSLECFDEDTLLTMNDLTLKKIKDTKVGDILYNNNKITAVFKINSDKSTMYTLNDTIVSNSHIVYYKEKWIQVSQHPYAIKYEKYNKPFLYCLNTDNKIINIGNDIYTDWDEIYDNTLTNFKKTHKLTNNKDIHRFLDGGFIGNTKITLNNGVTKEIQNIIIGDVLECGEIVRGLVQINGEDLNHQYSYTFGDKIIVGGPNVCICDKNIDQISTIHLDEKEKYILKEPEKILYHLLTDKKTFTVENIKFFDYNASVDLFLDKYKINFLSMKYV